MLRIDRKSFTVYNLIYYPTASVVKIEDSMLKVISDNGDDILKVGILYEYSADFEMTDPEFDENDITWCIVNGYHHHFTPDRRDVNIGFRLVR